MRKEGFQEWGKYGGCSKAELYDRDKLPVSKSLERLLNLHWRIGKDKMG